MMRRRTALQIATLLLPSAGGAEPPTTDAIYARRLVGGTILEAWGGYVVDEVQGAALKAIGRQTSGSASVSPPTISVDRAWYRGSNDKGTLGGAPNIAALTILKTLWDTANHHFSLLFTLQPTGVTNADNLDGMRYAAVDMYSQSVAGTTATLTSLGAVYYVQLPDRLYMTPGTDNSANNLARVTLDFISSSVSGAGPACRVTLYNVNGPSDTHCFYYNGVSTLVDAGQSWPVGITGASGAGGGGGGGTVGGGCLDPETPVLLRPGVLAPLHSVREGDLLWTRPEGGGEMGFHRVASVRHTSNLRCRVAFTDGRDFTCSINHLLNVRGLWRRADSLAPGEEVQGEPGGYVRSVEYLGEGPVVQLSIPTAGTYFGGNGVWQHNIFKP